MDIYLSVHKDPGEFPEADVCHSISAKSESSPVSKHNWAASSWQARHVCRPGPWGRRGGRQRRSACPLSRQGKAAVSLKLLLLGNDAHGRHVRSESAQHAEITQQIFSNGRWIKCNERKRGAPRVFSSWKPFVWKSVSEIPREHAFYSPSVSTVGGYYTTTQSVESKPFTNIDSWQVWFFWLSRKKILQHRYWYGLKCFLVFHLPHFSWFYRNIF